MEKLINTPRNGMEYSIVHSNELIESSYNLALDEVRLISYVASRIDSRKKNIGEIKIYPSDFADAFGLDRHNMHRNLINSIKSLANKSVTIRLDDIRDAVLPWLAIGIYQRQSNASSHVVVAFSQYIEPYLFELNERFTSINFEYASRLNTPFSFRLYQWLYKAKNLNNSKCGETVVVVLEIDWMKTRAGLDNKYAEWRDFSKFAIKPAVEKINSKTDISVFFKPVKTGRKVTAVEFAYVVEKATVGKPIRPRLFRRPKVKKGSHEEGVWMRKNLDLLMNYAKELKVYDSKAKMDLADLRKMAEYASIFDTCLEKSLRKEIADRSGNFDKHKTELRHL